MSNQQERTEVQRRLTNARQNARNASYHRHATTHPRTEDEFRAGTRSAFYEGMVAALSTCRELLKKPKNDV